MTGISRYFAGEPLRSVLGAIEGVNLIEISPQNIEQGAGTGIVCVVGECEDGPYNTPTIIRSSSDFIRTFGGFGFTHDGIPYQSPVARRSGGSELWNGNLYLGLYGNVFAGLVIVRVKTAAGSVRFRRFASLTATKRGPYDLEPGDTAAFEVDGAGVTATINATAATMLGVGGVYPSTFTGVEKILVKDEFGNIRPVSFAATDQANTEVRDAINKQLGYTAASIQGGQLQFVSRIRGAKGYFEIAGGTASAITQLGFTTTVTAEVDKVTIVVAAAGVYTFTVDVLYNGVITTYTGTFTRTVETIAQIRTALKLAFTTANPLAPVTLSDGAAGVINITSNVAGIPITTAVTATPNVGDFTTANVTPNSTNYARGTGNVQDVDRVLDPEIVTIVAALGGLNARMLNTGFARIWNDTTAETGTLKFVSGAVGLALGFTAGTLVNAGVGSKLSIPAGTRVEDDAGFRWVTCITTLTDTTGGPFDLDVRPALDDDSTPTAGIGELNTLVDVLDGEFEVSNAAILQRLSPANFDTAYATALGKTIDAGGPVAPLINHITCARFSESIDATLASNIPSAIKSEHAMRCGWSAPPLGFSVDDTMADTAQGVPTMGKSRNLFFCFPGVLVRVPAISDLGTEGGLGFADDGLINRRSNILCASIASRMAPEESIAQDLSRTFIGRQLHVVGLEDTYNSSRGGIALQVEDYIALRAAGVMTMKMDPDAGFSIQSDVTCKPEAENADESNGNHRRMWNFLGDSLRKIARPFVGTILRDTTGRVSLVESERGFLRDLKSENDPNQARIYDFVCNENKDPTLLALGHVDLDIRVQILPIYKHINLRTLVTAQSVTTAA